MGDKARFVSYFKAISKLYSFFLLSALAIPWLLVGVPFVADAQQTLNSNQIRGVLTIQWGDPRSGSLGGATRVTLNTIDGHRIPVDINALDSGVYRFFNRHVVVSGQFLSALSNKQSFKATEITVDDGGRAIKRSSVVSTKRVLFLLLKFSDDTATPHLPAFFDALSNPDTPPADQPIPATLNGFFEKTSWNQFHISADVGGVGGVPATDWLTLPYPKSHYANCGWSGSCANLSEIGDDGFAVGMQAGIDFTKYDNVNFVLSNDLDCCAWGGGYFSSTLSQSFGATWEPPWGQETGTYAHETGHSIGLPHSGWVYFSYDSPWDVMSDRTAAASETCGSYFSDNNSGQSSPLICTEPGDGYIAAHKDFLGWVPAANKIITDTRSTVSTTLEGDALPLDTAAKMVVVCIPGISCSSSGGHFLTIEARIGGEGSSSQYDNALTGDGVIIHDVEFNRPAIGVDDPCFFNSQSGWAVPVDATPGDYRAAPKCSAGRFEYPDYALYNTEWEPRHELIDPLHRVRVAIQQEVANTGYTIKTSPLVADLVELADVNGNGTGDKAVPVINKHGQSVATDDGRDGTTLSRFIIPTNYSAVHIASFSRESFVVLETTAAGTGARWQSVNARNGAMERTSPLVAATTAVDIAGGRLDGTQRFSVATLMFDQKSNQGVVELRSAAEAKLISHFTLTAGYVPLRMRTLPDIDENGSQEVATLERNPSTDDTQVEVRDLTSSAIIEVLDFGTGFEPADILTISDTDSSAGTYVAVAGTIRAKSACSIRIRDVARPNKAANIGCGEGFDAIALAGTGDLAGTGNSDIAILRRSSAQGIANVVVYNRVGGKKVTSFNLEDSDTFMPAAISATGYDPTARTETIDVMGYVTRDSEAVVKSQNSVDFNVVSTLIYP